MEIDLDAIIAAAHRAQQSCDYRLGSCSRILHIGFFFDGVEMHSRHNTLDMSAQKELTITSTDDEIVISTPKTLTVNGGGSYLKLSDSGIEHGSKGDLTMKVGEYLVPGSGGDMPFSAPDFNSTEIAEVKRVISKPLSN